MSERLAMFTWTLLGTGGFAFLGSLFGGLASGLSRKQGRATGTIWASRVAHALSQLFARRLSPIEMSVLTGAVDGALFLGIVGLFVGLIAGWQQASPGLWVATALAIAAPLMIGAALFGLLSYGLVRVALGALILAIAGAMIGATLAVVSYGVSHIVPGIAVGLFVGTGLALLAGRLR